MTLTREHIVTSVHNHLELPKNRSAEVVDSILEIIEETLASGEDVGISGFGKFCVRSKKKRRGRNPQTGEEVMLRARSSANATGARVRPAGPMGDRAPALTA